MKIKNYGSSTGRFGSAGFSENIESSQVCPALAVIYVMCCLIM